jgi:hypothetical protein
LVVSGRMAIPEVYIVNLFFAFTKDFEVLVLSSLQIIKYQLLTKCSPIDKVDFRLIHLEDK